MNSVVTIEISGHTKEDPFVKSIINDQLRSEMEKLKKIIPINKLHLHIDHYKESGNRTKYSIKARLITEKGLFFSQNSSWDLSKTVRGILQNLEREVIRKKENIKHL